MINEYPKAYRAIYNIIKDFKNNYRRQPMRIEVLKLLYLLDVDYYKRFGECYSEMDYMFYNHGPWTQEFHQTLDYMKENEIAESQQQTKDGRDYYLYSVTAKTPRETIDIDQDALEILSNIFFIYKHSELTEMLNIVYTEEPMASTNRGELIDMSKVVLSSRKKREQYRQLRAKQLDKVASLDNNPGEDDLAIFNEFKIIRDRANNTI